MPSNISSQDSLCHLFRERENSHKFIRLLAYLAKNYPIFYIFIYFLFVVVNWGSETAGLATKEMRFFSLGGFFFLKGEILLHQSQWENSQVELNIKYHF